MDSDGDGVDDLFYYSEDYREWHQFNSHSSSSGTVNYVGRTSHTTYYMDYFSQTFTETWNFTYREDWSWWISLFGPDERHTSSPEAFIENTEDLWTNTVTAQELSEGVEAAKLEYGEPPANALRRVKVSLNGKRLPADVRDTWYNVENWEWTWGHAGTTGLDELGFLSLVGALKYADEANALRKGCNCFTAGTKVHTDEGEKPIEEIEVGDKVLSKSDETGEVLY